ncbi:MAG: hypothetical protein HY841_08640 [Bacteroidetes bacterium]|nr:hypothetical protein [Bacteroidota bacterium]
MKIEELQIKIQELNIPNNWYYIDENIGRLDNETNIIVSRNNNTIAVYQNVFNDGITKSFTEESVALDYVFENLKDLTRLRKINATEGLDGMTTNERLFVSGLMNEFDIAKLKDKVRAKQILRCLKLDEQTIREIVK